MDSHRRATARVTAFTGKVEIGQNIRTSLAQVVADELRVPIAAVDVRDGRHRPHAVRSGHVRIADDADDGAAAGAGGGDGARAADRSAQPSDGRSIARSLTADAGRVRAADGRTVDVRRAHRRQASSTGRRHGEPAIAPKTRWKLRGTPVKKVNGRDIVTGRTPSRPISSRPGMVFGRVVRPPAYGATLQSVDDPARAARCPA